MSSETVRRSARRTTKQVSAYNVGDVIEVSSFVSLPCAKLLGNSTGSCSMPAFHTEPVACLTCSNITALSGYKERHRCQGETSATTV